jgi:hypothetical protein
MENISKQNFISCTKVMQFLSKFSSQNANKVAQKKIRKQKLEEMIVQKSC